MKLNDEQRRDLIDYLQGSCKTMDEGLQALGVDFPESDLTSKDWSLIEAEIMLCQNCGWWMEAYEVTDGTCSECSGEE